jgi:hypothetical protein
MIPDEREDPISADPKILEVPYSRFRFRLVPGAATWQVIARRGRFTCTTEELEDPVTFFQRVLAALYIWVPNPPSAEEWREVIRRQTR